MKLRLRSTTSLPPLYILILLVSVTSATWVTSTFSLRQYSLNLSASSGATTTDILSCDSLIANSVEFSPLYFTGTLSRYMSRPSVSSPMATLTPPAPKSLDFLMRLVTSGLRKSLWSFLSSGAFPFWTSLPHVSRDSSVCSLDEPVAPPIPSRPVLPPSRRTMSPGTGDSLRTLSAFTAPTTAPTSRRLAV